MQMTGGQTRGNGRTAVLVTAAVAMASVVVAFHPAAAKASTFDPSVATVVLQTSKTPVTSSVSRDLRVQFTATHPVGYNNAADTASVAVFKGRKGLAEDHRWTFTVPASSFDVDDTGSGTVAVPTSAISPFGKIALRVSPIGEPTQQSCNGSVRSQTQQVSVKGTFYFDTRSKGAHKWGSVGSKAKRFVFGATNTIVTTDDLPPTPCPTGTAQCVAESSWSAAHGKIDLLGANVSGSRASFVATRRTTLSVPADATRIDELFAKTEPLTVKQKPGGAATLALAALVRSSGTAKLSAAKASQFSAPCTKDGVSYTQTYQTWDAAYIAGKKPLAAHAQIFGAVKLGDVTGPGNASFSTVSYA